MTMATKKTKSRKKNIRKKKKNSSWKMKLFKNAVLFGFICAVFLSAYVAYCYLTMPDIKKAVTATRQPSTTIIAENGNDIAKFGNVYAEVIYPDNLPKNLTNAVIATEDRRFYSHFGFDVIGFSRAMITNLLKSRYAQGASTITQQVAKNIFLTPNKTIKRKVQELILAFWLEKKLTKQQIMALYLNRVYFGSGNYGADAAAHWYFNKSVYDLNLRESAILAGMLKAPTRYNPTYHRQAALDRADIVLQNMRANRLISEKEYTQAKQMPIADGQSSRVTGGKHFAQYVYDEVNDFIGERSEDVMVATTLDQNLQEAAEKILQTKIAAAQSSHVSEGAVIVMDNSGAVKAMVGGIDYNKSQFNRAVQAKRQAGSAFKPFVYLTALQYGFKPDSLIHDGPVSIGKWKPENYTKKYYGDVTMTYALAHSLNAATVVLSKELYIKDIADNARKMGISTPISLSPSMVLGTNNVKLIDMAAAYASIANGGYAVWPHAINEVATLDGRQIYVRQNSEQKQILESSVVQSMTLMMEQVINQGTGKKARLPVFAAGKSGTSQNYRDAWFIGWINGYTAAVWVGNDNEKPMNKVGGGSLPAEIWHDVMMYLVDHKYTFDDVSRGTSPKSSDDIADLIDEENSQNDGYSDAPQNLDELINSL